MVQPPAQLNVSPRCLPDLRRAIACGVVSLFHRYFPPGYLILCTYFDCTKRQSRCSFFLPPDPSGRQHYHEADGANRILRGEYTRFSSEYNQGVTDRVEGTAVTRRVQVESVLIYSTLVVEEQRCSKVGTTAVDHLLIRLCIPGVPLYTTYAPCTLVRADIPSDDTANRLCRLGTSFDEIGRAKSSTCHTLACAMSRVRLFLASACFRTTHVSCIIHTTLLLYSLPNLVIIVAGNFPAS